MKKIKLGVCGFLIGQTLALFYKDETFKEKFNKAEGLDKAKTLVDGLVDLNKKIFFDLKNVDYSTKTEEIKSYVLSEKEKLENKANDIKSKINELNDEKLKPMIDDLEERYSYLRNYVETKYEDLDEKYKVQDKVDNIKEKINDIKKNMKK